MKNGNRDLLVLTKGTNLDPMLMEHEVEILNDILFSIENLQTFCVAHEIIDINKYKILQKPHLIQEVIKSKEFKSFVFLYNKN
jgi:hypothetical protein